MANKHRCAWATNALLTEYHDREWGVPLHDDHRLFEMLNLEGAQAGLSWQTILARRDGYRATFDSFDAAKMAAYGDAKRAALLADERIIRNRLKVNAFIENAKAYLHLVQEYGSFDAYLWSFVHGRHLTHADAAAATVMSEQLSKALKKRSFRFVGPTSCFAFMQSVGMVNDHTPECFRFQEIEQLAAA